MEGKFFVTIMAASQEELGALQQYHLDLFRTTANKLEMNVLSAILGADAQEARQPQFGIEGLVTLEDIGRLVEDGYQVLVSRPAPRQAQVKAIEFDEWLKGLEG